MNYFKFLIFTILFFTFVRCNDKKVDNSKVEKLSGIYTVSHLDSINIPNDSSGALIKYGRELFLRTSYYIGPMGKVKAVTGNKGNCTNCHIDGGTRLFGNNLLDTYGRYPSYRGREGKMLTIEERINNCIERPMLGVPIDFTSREMKAFVAYFRWLGQDRKISNDFDSTHLGDLTFIDRAGDIEKGKKVYQDYCQRCHNANGEGVLNSDNISYKYPPLWGEKAYAKGSSMHRNIMFAKYVKWTMPQDKVVNSTPILTDEQAIDVACFVNSQERFTPNDLTEMYPNISDKQIDYPFGPYHDGFSEEQHTLGPWQPIVEARKKLKKK